MSDWSWRTLTQDEAHAYWKARGQGQDAASLWLQAQVAQAATASGPIAVVDRDGGDD